MFSFASDISEHSLPDWLNEEFLGDRSSVLTGFAFPNILTEISLLLVDDPNMREINRGQEGERLCNGRPVFPLSFDEIPWELPPTADKKFGPVLSLGEIVISWDTCKAQAKQIGHSEKEEFFRLFVHGFLHLIGYDHERGESDEALMKEKEDLCLDLVLGP